MKLDPFVHVLCITDDAHLGGLVMETIAASLPSSVVEIDEGDLLAVDALTRASCMVIDGNLHNAAGVDVLRRFRAAGFQGAAVLLLSEPAPGLAMRAAALGAPVTVLKREISVQLPAAVVAAARSALTIGEWRDLYSELRRTQRLIALGQMAAKLRHDLSNPMTVISSECQMMQMDPALPEQYRHTVKEILAMCRRVNGIVRELDVFVAVPIPESRQEHEAKD